MNGNQPKYIKPHIKAGDSLLELLYRLKCISYTTYMVAAWNQVGKKLDFKDIYDV